MSVQIGEQLPAMTVNMTAQKIISAAAATRDWQPIHHDHEIAQKSGLRGIILNAPSQAGWISRFITDAYPQAQIKRLAFKMKDSICPGDQLRIEGEISAVDGELTCIHVRLSVGDRLKTSAEVTVAL